MSVLDLLPGLSEGDVLLGAGARSEVRVVVERPRCACGHAFGDDALAKINFKTRSIACAACGLETRARLVRDDSIADARWVLGERDDAVAVADGIVLRCGACGAPAKGHGGVEVCAFCGARTVPGAGAPKPAAARIHVVLSVRGSPH